MHSRPWTKSPALICEKACPQKGRDGWNHAKKSPSPLVSDVMWAEWQNNLAASVSLPHVPHRAWESNSCTDYLKSTQYLQNETLFELHVLVSIICITGLSSPSRRIHLTLKSKVKHGRTPHRDLCGGAGGSQDGKGVDKKKGKMLLPLK